MKIILMALFAGLLLAQNAFALQEVAENSSSIQASPITCLALVSGNYLAIVFIIVLIFIAFAFLLTKKFPRKT